MSMRVSSKSHWLSLGTLAALVAALAALVVATLPVGAQAGTATASATLSGDAEVPVVVSDGTGSFSATIDLDTYTITYQLDATATAITQAHIHVGPADDNGGVAAFLFGPVDPGEDTVSAGGVITPDDVVGDFTGKTLVEAILAGNTYVNVHTAANPAGEVRGQIAAVTEEPADDAPADDAPADDAAVDDAPADDVPHDQF